jgi:hypothetical protein
MARCAMSRWVDVRILKNSNDTFTIYAEDWTKEANNTIDLLEKDRQRRKKF